MSDEYEPPIVRTDIGRAGFGDNWVRGRSLRHDLVGKHGHWSVLAISLGAPPLTERQNLLLDEAAVACVAADPRIWPLKLTWLLASFGSPWAGMAAVTASLADAYVGPDPAIDAARTCRALVKACESPVSGKSGTAPMLAWLRGQRDAGVRVPGFGVPGSSGGRHADERNEFLSAAAHRHDEVGPHLRAVEQLTAALEGESLRPNGALFLNAILLDVGFKPKHTPMVVMQMFNLQFWSQAFEASLISASSLQRLPKEAIDYKGEKPRTSARALTPR